jgi:hypothetical protein
VSSPKGNLSSKAAVSSPTLRSVKSISLLLFKLKREVFEGFASEPVGKLLYEFGGERWDGAISRARPKVSMKLHEVWNLPLRVPKTPHLHMKLGAEIVIVTDICANCPPCVRSDADSERPSTYKLLILGAFHVASIPPRRSNP